MNGKILSDHEARVVALFIFSQNWCFSNFLRLSALKNEPTAQLRQYIIEGQCMQPTIKRKDMDGQH